MKLYREAAISSRANNQLGEIVFVRPPSFAYITAFSVVFILICSALFFFGSYTSRIEVPGELVPNLGVVMVQPPQAGIIVKKLVEEGEYVEKGRTLFIISNERRTVGGTAEELIADNIRSKLSSVNDEISKTSYLEHEERQKLEAGIANLRAEALQIDQQIANQNLRLSLAKEAAARDKDLLKRGYISRSQADKSDIDVLDQIARLQSLAREKTNKAAEILTQENLLHTLAARYETQRATLHRELHTNRQELITEESKRTMGIVAPTDGVATSIKVQVGESIDANRSLLAIIPKGSELEARLYAPTSAVGFIRPGSKVLLRYRAYPYQKYGHGEGTVASVTRVASIENGAMVSTNPTAMASNEPVYRIVVRLASKQIFADGQEKALQAGMSLDADVMQDTRPLYQWILDPLYKIFAKPN